MKVPIREWQKDFEKLCVPFYKTKHKDEIKSFISSLLKEERERVIGEVEEMLEDENIRYLSYVSTSNARARNQLRAELRSKLKDSFTDCRK